MYPAALPMVLLWQAAHAPFGRGETFGGYFYVYAGYTCCVYLLCILAVYTCCVYLLCILAVLYTCCVYYTRHVHVCSYRVYISGNTTPPSDISVC